MKSWKSGRKSFFIKKGSNMNMKDLHIILAFTLIFIPLNKGTIIAKFNVKDIHLLSENEKINGIPIDYSFNQTSPGDSAVSAPGCPKSMAGHPWIYFGTPPTCFPSGFQGPCPPNQILTLEKTGTHAGICHCEACQHSSITRKSSSDGRYTICGDRQVYDEHAKTCHHLNTQGPCDPTHLLQLNKRISNSVECQLKNKKS